MLKNLPKEETPSAKRRLMVDAFQLALAALGTVKECGADDEDFIFSYLFYFVIQPNKVKDFRPFSQLWFTLLFDVESDRDLEKPDEVRRFFNSLFFKIKTNQEDDATKVIERATYLMI